MSEHTNMQQLQLLVETRKEQEAVYIPADHNKVAAMGGALQLDQREYSANSYAYFKDLHNSISKLNTTNDPSTAYSLLYDGKSTLSNHIAILLPGFSDEAPASPPEVAGAYAEAGSTNKAHAQPTSWGPLVRSGIVSRMLTGAGLPMPLITAFRPIAPTFQDAHDIRRGNFASYADLVQDLVHAATDRLHGSVGTSSFDTVHLFGISLGGPEAIGATREINRRRYGLKIGSLTLQELIVGPHNLLELSQYTRVIGDASLYTTDGFVCISESVARKALYRRGSELQMFGRMAKAMLKISLLQGLTHPEATRDTLAEIVEQTPVTVALADNSQASAQTHRYLPDHVNMHRIQISAVSPARIGHIVNELFVATGTVAAIGVQQSDYAIK